MNERYVREAITDIMKQHDSIILEQLGDLVKRGLIVVEQTQPMIVQDPISMGYKLCQSVRLVSKEHEYIKELERERDFYKTWVSELKVHLTSKIIEKELKCDQ